MKMLKNFWSGTYHFTIGGALHDDRILTLPAYNKGHP